ncbi:hypothetical protein BYT27DRAFT_6721134 [Phlegmacium glaucopus]|nr:hypothetical protein BYT27DRAFT_6721134 [Phlegmacium glaucopus]
MTTYDDKGQLFLQSIMTYSALQSSDEGRKSLRSYPTIVHVAVASAFVLPIAFLPYWAARRQIFALCQRVERLEMGAKHLRESLDITSSTQTWTNGELRRIHSRIQKAIKESHDWQAHVDRQKANRIASDETIQTELHRLLQETQQSRDIQTTTLRALGVSLADIAAFIQEVELDFGMLSQGKDRRGVERMRSLALKMTT